MNIEEKYVRRFWSRVKKSDGCWEWTGGVSPHPHYPYGRMAINRKHFFAHRISWVLFNGDIPAGMFVCHKCDNVKCVNPDHLFVGTAKNNSDDKVKKGRQAKGEGNGGARLTSKQVETIRSMCSCGVTQKRAGKMFGVSQAQVSRIVLGKKWAHV